METLEDDVMVMIHNSGVTRGWAGWALRPGEILGGFFGQNRGKQKIERKMKNREGRGTRMGGNRGSKYQSR